MSWLYRRIKRYLSIRFKSVKGLLTVFMMMMNQSKRGNRNESEKEYIIMKGMRILICTSYIPQFYQNERKNGL